MSDRLYRYTILDPVTGEGRYDPVTVNYEEAHRTIDNWMVDNWPATYVPTGVVVAALDAALEDEG